MECRRQRKITAVCINSFAIAQTTKLSSNAVLSGINLNGRPVLLNAQNNLLFTTNGTPEGTKAYTTKVIFDNAGAGNGIVLNNRLYFAGRDGINGSELWVTDGTNAGTGMVKNIRPDDKGSNPRRFCVMNSELYFFADDGSHGIELWKSDGTEPGTVMVKDINPGKDSCLGSDIYTIIDSANGALYFFADDGVHGMEPWKTDGTEIGTVLIKDINLNGGSFSYFQGGGFNNSFTALGDNVIFGADDGVHGMEPWKTIFQCLCFVSAPLHLFLSLKKNYDF